MEKKKTLRPKLDPDLPKLDPLKSKVYCAISRGLAIRSGSGVLPARVWQGILMDF